MNYDDNLDATCVDCFCHITPEDTALAIYFGKCGDCMCTDHDARELWIEEMLSSLQSEGLL